VVTTKAKTKIKQLLNEEKTKAAAEGKEILMRRLKNWKIPYGDTVIKKLLDSYNLKTAQDLYFLIASEKIDLLQIKELLQKDEQTEVAAEESMTISPEKEPKEKYDYQPDYLIIEDRVEGLDYKLAKCCNPVFGDSIFGFVTISEGIKIHRTGCPNANNLMSRYPYRLIAARWSKTGNIPTFIATIKITGIADQVIVNRIADVISESRTTIRSFNYNMNEGLFEGTLNIMVPNYNTLQLIIRRIHGLKGILRAIRADAG
jgi:GTP pyrophosphokinase